ncbi:MAG TPA: hypothetical protein VKC66_37760 [Xanthobacteraceae bacterium]|nr:hypothetical protein [Xanthobacteraceae bacterium]
MWFHFTEIRSNGFDVAVSGAMRQRGNVARGLLAALTIMLATRQNICSEATTAGGNLHAAIDRSFHAPI